MLPVARPKQMASRSVNDEIAQAETDLATALLRVDAAQTRLTLTSAALNQLEAKVNSMGASPRYRVAWEKSLQDAHVADDEAQAALANAQSEFDRISAMLTELKRQH